MSEFSVVHREVFTGLVKYVVFTSHLRATSMCPYPSVFCNEN